MNKKPWLVILSSLLLALSAGAGTSVGNFMFRTQVEFDFRLGFPLTWKWEEVATNGPGEVNRWLLSNQISVSDPAHVSSVVVSFRKDVAAANDQQLLKEIQRLHPTLKWKALSNPDFTIGFVSDQVQIATERFQSFEYYFSRERRIVRVESIRDSSGNGAAELDTILTTIRRPSGAPRIVSVTTPLVAMSKVGELFCFQIEVDLLKNDFDRDSLGIFELRGTHPHWSFKSVVWDKAKSAFTVCERINRHFSADGLRITQLRIGSRSGAMVSCVDDASSPTPKLVCLDAEKTSLAYKVPTVENRNPARSAPVISALKAGPSGRLLFTAQSSAPLSIGEVTIEALSNGAKNDSQILYADQLRAGDNEIVYEPARLKPGFTRVLELSLTDDVGNAVKLKAQGSDSTYTRFSTDGDSTPTALPVISLIGGAK